MQTVERVGKIEFNHNMARSQTVKVAASRVGGCLAAQTATFIGIVRKRPGLLRHAAGPISHWTKRLL